ncbi:MAG TPA: hypothetical protein VF210_12395 [Pseudomonadales bacterium]
MRMEDMVIASADDHIVEPPDMFENQLSDTLWPDYPEGLWRSIQSVPGGIPDHEIDLTSHDVVGVTAPADD